MKWEGFENCIFRGKGEGRRQVEPFAPFIDFVTGEKRNQLQVYDTCYLKQIPSDSVVTFGDACNYELTYGKGAATECNVHLHNRVGLYKGKRKKKWERTKTAYDL